MGPCPITWESLAAWAQMTDRSPVPWEVDTLRAIDGAWLREAALTKQ